jgi:putative exporter of polyketide antibiotics
MPTLALVVGVVLVAIGLGTYVGTGAHAPTALIPAVLGLLIAVAGLVARTPRLRMHAMHAAVLVALLGVLGCVPGLLKLPALLGGTAERPVAVVAQIVTLLVCLGFVVSAVRSFIEARKSRAGAS